MYQQFALTVSPKTGRVSLRPVIHGILLCKSAMTFRNEAEARAYLDKWHAVRLLGGDTINGTYRMEIVPQEQEVSR